jgi:hypothetical protein
MKFLVQNIKKSKLYKWVHDLCNTNAAAKIIVSIIIWGIAFIPTYFYLFVRWGIGPVGFWQELALFLVFAFCLGWSQGILMFIAIMLTIGILIEEL